MNHLITGAMTMGYLVAALFFLRFWKKSKDQLFLFFAIAFFLLGGQRLALGVTAERLEDDTVFYVIRLAAYVLILVAIWLKNRSSRP
jgi:hypothetical protein